MMELSKEETALKPCPFCGGKAVQNNPSEPHGGMVHCEQCGAEAFGPKWNRRAALPAADQQPPKVKLPKLTDAMILAAAEGHYGKRLTSNSGGPSGIALTVNGYDWSFDQAFRRMWKGVQSALETSHAK